MKAIALLACLYILSIQTTFSQTGSVTGTIVNEVNIPVPDVNIYIGNLDRGTSTDKLGRFILSHIPAGNTLIHVSAIGYQSIDYPIEIKPGEATILSITLQPGELLLKDVVVTDQFEHEINTISQIDIRLRPTNTSQDILRMVPGLFIAQHAGGGKAEQIFLRGFDIDHGTDINLEVDGLPVNMVSHAHGQGYSDLHFLIPETVDKVDFNKGPYYGDKGNLTTAGYVSFHTKNSFDQNMVKLEGGSFGTLRNVNTINLLARTKGENQSLASIASEFFRTDGFFEQNQHFSRINIAGKFSSYYGDDEMLTLGLSVFSSQWDASGQIPTRAVESGQITRFGSIDPTEGGETSRTNVWLRYLNTNQQGGIWENQFSFSQYTFYLVSNFSFYLNDPVNGDQITQSEARKIWSYRGSYFKEYPWAGLNAQTEIGYGVRYDAVGDLHLYHTVSRKQFIGDVARGDVDETNAYVYLNQTLQFNPKLSLNVAARLDHFTFTYSDALTPEYNRQNVSKAVVSLKLNFSYNATRNLNLFLKCGIGFHSNDTRVVVAQSGEDILPKAYGVDVGGTFKIGNDLLVSSALWWLALDQEFVYVGDEGIVEPSGETHRKGLDVSVRYQVNTWLYLDGDVNWCKPRSKGEPEGQNYIPLAPVLTSIGGVSVQLKNGFNGSFRYRYMGDRPANEANSVVATGYFLADAVVKYTTPKFEISLTAENLFNTTWNEAQFDTESRLYDEPGPVSEIHFTPGTPAFFKAGVSFFF